MRVGQKVRLTKSVVNGYKQWHKGEVVTINHFTTLAGKEYARVTDNESHVSLQPVEWLEEITDDTINDLAFLIMHTEDLDDIHGLANRIYIMSLQDELTVKERYR